MEGTHITTLTVSRKVEQRVVIAGNITVEVKEASRGKAVLAITAPRNVSIDREEVHNAKSRKAAAAVRAGSSGAADE